MSPRPSNSRRRYSPGRQALAEIVLRSMVRLHRMWNRARAVQWRRGLARLVYRPGLWDEYSHQAAQLTAWLDYTQAQVAASAALHQQFPGELDVRSITWFIPDFYNAYYGGVHTILRFANHFAERYGVRSHFVLIGTMSEQRIRTSIAEAFPRLANSSCRRLRSDDDVQSLEPTDAAVATLWSTAYFVMRFNATKRKFYFMQDYEPLFYPAGSTYAQVDATYRFGFYGIANTPAIMDIYEREYGGTAHAFIPCVDSAVFHSNGRAKSGSGPFTVFFYGRPGHPRNGFELGAEALRKLKVSLRKRVCIVSAGAEWQPRAFRLDGVVENLGLLGYEHTAELYRQCDAGLVMMFTRHPSYLPLELMASGCLVVTNHNPATQWLLQDGENCLLAGASASELAATLERGLLNADERRKITEKAVCEVRQHHSDWTAQMESVWDFIRLPVQGSRSTDSGGAA